MISSLRTNMSKAANADDDVQIPFSGGRLGTASGGLQQRGDRMILKPLMAAVAMTAAVSAMSVVVPSSAHAQSGLRRRSSDSTSSATKATAGPACVLVS